MVLPNHSATTSASSVISKTEEKHNFSSFGRSEQTLFDRVVPMLPEVLSNNVCSLRPNEEKLCFSSVFEMTDEAEVVAEWFGRTIINSDRRFTYEEAQLVIETEEGEL